MLEIILDKAYINIIGNLKPWRTSNKEWRKNVECLDIIPCN